MHARFRIRIHVCGDALRPTSRRTPRLLLAGDDDATMTTPGVVRGLHPETCVPSAKISFFTSRMILGKLHTAVRSRTARSFPRVGASCSRVHSWAGRSFTRSKARGRTRASTGRCARPVRPVSFYRIAMSFPRVRDLECSRCESPRLVRLQRDETTRGDDASSIK